MLNKVIIMGRLTADPEIRTTASGNEVTSFCVAVDRPFSKDKDAVRADFFNVVAWNNTARFVCNYFTKGQAIAIDGRLQTKKYKDKNGENRTITEIIANEVSFCGGKPEKERTAEGGIQGFSNVGADDFNEIVDDEDLPF